MSVLQKFRKKTQQQTGAVAPVAAPTAKVYFHGAFRSDENGLTYWMEPDELNELAILNAKIDDDREFYKAFRELRQRYGIKPTRGTYGPPRKEAFGGGESTYEWQDPTKKKGYLSEWWGGWKSTFGTWGGGNDAKLALSLRSLAVVLDVIDDSPVRSQISFATELDQPVSFTDFTHNRIVVSPMALLDPKISEGEGIDITNGLGMHEASHGKYTRHLAKDLEAKPILPMAVAALLLNIIEDVRIEKLTSTEYPGFVGYFDKANDFMWSRGAKPPKAYGPDLATKLNCAIGFCKWPQHFPDKQWGTEKAWWTDWRDRYLTDAIDHRTAIDEGLAHLRMPTEDEEKKGKTKPDPRSENGKQGGAGAELDQMEEDEKHAASFREFMRDWLERNKDKIKDFCAHGSHDSDEVLDSDQVQRITQLVDEEIENHRPPITASGNRPPRVLVTKPKETSSSKRFWDGRFDPLVAKYREAIRLRPVKPLHTIKLMKNGKVDSTQLWRWAGDDYRVFQQREIADRPAARMYLLIDMSGSMSGEKLHTAQQVARLFLMALNQIDGVHTKVYGHTGDVTVTSTADIYRLWEPGDPLSRLGLIMDKRHGNNYDGYAIGYVAQQIEKDSQPNEQKVLIVLSDGYPAGTDYGGAMAEAHMRKVVSTFHNKGVRILQIAIDRSLADGRQARMFREYIPFHPGDSLADIPKRLTKYLLKVL